MRTITKTVYLFNELNDEAKNNAIQKHSDINVFSDWWDSTYEDARNIGLKITSFDLDRNRNAKGEFLVSALEVAQNILNEHGEMCETYKTAKSFLDEHAPIYTSYLDESSDFYESPDKEEELIELESEFLNSLLEDYSIILQNESEYLCSEEAIIETIIANEREFDEFGNSI